MEPTPRGNERRVEKALSPKVDSNWFESFFAGIDSSSFPLFSPVDKRWGFYGLLF